MELIARRLVRGGISVAGGSGLWPVFRLELFLPEHCAWFRGWCRTDVWSNIEALMLGVVPFIWQLLPCAVQR